MRAGRGRLIASRALFAAGLCAGAALARATEPVGGGVAALVIDPAQSALTFTIHRSGETIEGRAHDFTGEAALDSEHPDNGATVVLRVKAVSLETGNRVRDHRMRGSHLEVDRFPEIVFRSTTVRLSAAGRPAPGSEPPAEPVRPAPPLRPGEDRRALLEGILSLHGVDRPMLFPATIRYDSGSLTAEGDLTLRLTDHSIPIPRFLWIVLDDEVKVHFRFVAFPHKSAASGAPPPATTPVAATSGAD